MGRTGNSEELGLIHELNGHERADHPRAVPTQQAVVLGVLSTVLLVGVFVFVTPRGARHEGVALAEPTGTPQSLLQRALPADDSTQARPTTSQAPEERPGGGAGGGNSAQVAVQGGVVACHMSALCLNTTLEAAVVAPLPDGVPPLHQFGNDVWPDSGTRECSPAVSNELGFSSMCDANGDLCRDVAGLGHWSAAPSTHQTACALTTRVDGRAVDTTALHWRPYEARREADGTDHDPAGLSVVSVLRLAKDGDGQGGVLVNLTVATNDGSALDGHVLAFDVQPQWERLGVLPPSGPSSAAGRWEHTVSSTSLTGCTVAVKDTLTGVEGALSFRIGNNTATLSTAALANHTTLTLTFTTALSSASVWFSALSHDPAVRESNRTVASRAQGWSQGRHFRSLWEAPERRWAHVWASAFTPNNHVFSGNLPVLTSNHSALNRVYYASCLALLLRMRSTAPHIAPRVYPTHPPDVLSLWETSHSAFLLALLDPAALRALLLSLLSSPSLVAPPPPRSPLSPDAPVLSGSAFRLSTPPLPSPVGPSSHFAAPALVWLLDTLVSATNDTALLHTPVPAASNRAVLELMSDLALEWLTNPARGAAPATEPSAPNTTTTSAATGATAAATTTATTTTHAFLADYGGDARGLLPCAPTYLHVVPALQALSVHMLRCVANFRQAQGDDAEASRLRKFAKEIARATVSALWVSPEDTNTNNNNNSGNNATVTVGVVMDGDVEQGRWVCRDSRLGSPSRVKSAMDAALVARGMLQDLPASTRRAMANALGRKTLAHQASQAVDGAASMNALVLLASDFAPLLSPPAPERARGGRKARLHITTDPPSAQPAAREGLGRPGGGTVASPLATLDPLRGGAGARGTTGCGVDGWDGGSAFADVVVRTVFGVRFRFDGECSLLLPRTPRRVNGMLSDVRVAAGTVSVCSGAHGLKFC